MSKAWIVLSAFSMGTWLTPICSAAQTANVTVLPLKPSRNLEIACQLGQNISKTYSGAAESLSVLRVGSARVSYEIYLDDFLVATCDHVSVD